MKLHEIIKRASDVGLRAVLHAGEDGKTVSIHFHDASGHYPLQNCVIIDGLKIDGSSVARVLPEFERYAATKKAA